jgi:hypothetical protein
MSELGVIVMGVEESGVEDWAWVGECKPKSMMISNMRALATAAPMGHIRYFKDGFAK